MSVAISVWLKSMLAQTPGAVRPIVHDKFREAVSEFYKDSQCMRETVRRDVVADTAAYTIVPDTAGVLTIVPLRVAYNGTPLAPLLKQPDEVVVSTGTPRRWYRVGVSTIVLWPTPTEALVNGLSVYIAVQPDTSLTTLPDISKTEHFDALLDGGLGLLKQQPAKPYTDLVTAQYHLKRFRTAIARYKGQANKGNVPSGAGWSFNDFGK